MAVIKEYRGRAPRLESPAFLAETAAIVGLTLGKPVIVGALGATKKLEDGMHISVDAERGVVRAMPD